MRSSSPDFENAVEVACAVKHSDRIVIPGQYNKDEDPSPEQVMERIKPFRTIVETKSLHRIVYRDYDGKRRTMVCDLFTANAVVSVFDQVNDASKVRLCGLLPPAMVKVVWRVLG